MNSRFIPFTIKVSRLNKNIQKLKQEGMKSFSCKGSYTLCIYQLREKPEGMTSREIAAGCDFDPGLVSRILRELQQQELVGRDGEEGKYLSRYYLTKKGKALAEEIARTADRIQAYVDEGITEEELAVFYRVLARLEQNFTNLLDETLQSCNTI